MEESILTSTKKILGIAEEYEAFDLDIITHINTALTTLNQLGIGPSQGFEIEDASAVWEDFFGTDSRFNSIKSYVFLRVRTLFDPPTMGYLVELNNKQILEFEWRLSVLRDDKEEELP